MENILESVQIILLFLELFILLTILMHMNYMRSEDKLLKENLNELSEFHQELHESIGLLKEDISDLTENNQKLEEFIRTCKVETK